MYDTCMYTKPNPNKQLHLHAVTQWKYFKDFIHVSYMYETCMIHVRYMHVCTQSPTQTNNYIYMQLLNGNTSRISYMYHTCMKPCDNHMVLPLQSACTHDCHMIFVSVWPYKCHALTLLCDGDSPSVVSVEQ